MNRGPWESWQGGAQTGGATGGARPRNPRAQSTSMNGRASQSTQHGRSQTRMPKFVSTTNKGQAPPAGASQQNTPSREAPRNAWRQIPHSDTVVSFDENLLQEQVSRKSKETDQLLVQNRNEVRQGQRTYTILNFTVLNKLADSATEPSEIARKLTERNALADFLETNKQNLEILELVIVTIGQFCQNNGPTQFYNAFVKILTTLGEKRIFAEIPTIIMHLPGSRATNLGPKEERLERLVQSVARLTTEMLTIMPALSCNVLGKDFIEDVYSMAYIPSIRAINNKNVFNVLLDVKERLQNVWEQHSKVEDKEQKEDYRAAIRVQREELLSALEPPDDFRTLSVMPGRDDLCVDQEPFLRPNKAKGSYRDVDAYLDVQFRLLREDFFGPLREGLVSYRDMIKKNPKKQIRVDNIRIYQDVKITNYDVKTNAYTIEFSVKTLKKVNWDASKRLIYGSLLLLTMDHFDSFLLFTVADRKGDQLAKGTFKAFFEGDALPAYATKEVMVMAESAVFFEAYRSVLIALQRVSPAHFPLENHILCKNLDPQPPYYLSGIEMPVYDLRPVRPDMSKLKEDGRMLSHVEQRLMRASILDPYTRPQFDILGLDPSQSEALYAALTRNVVVIQGPPGTGKTFLGLKIVQTLLRNNQFWTGNSKRPILAICYTNHALDQFLEGILKFTKKIVRIGSQSKCEALERYNLREWKKQSMIVKRTSPNRRWFHEVRTQLADLRREWQKYRDVSQNLDKSVLLHEESLLNLDIINKGMYDKLKTAGSESVAGHLINSSLAKWLRLDSVQSLQELLAAFQRSRKVVTVQTVEEVENDDAVEEEGWEQEDIDEIQGQRMQMDDIYERIYSSDDSTAHNDVIEELPEFYISFSFSLNSVLGRISELSSLITQLEGDDVDLVRRQIREQTQLKELFVNLMEAVTPIESTQAKVLLSGDLRRIRLEDRWRIYAHWRNLVQEKLAVKIMEKEKIYRQTENELKDVDTLDTAEIIRDVDVIGITTTGAAKQRALLEHVKPKIVVVEEAAEVLEAHIVTSLSASCQHLILIGDHQQLRPSTTVYKLAKDYHLDVSLFERLILNGLRPCVLSVQHRMRPEVARLIVPSIYPHLENHESVLEYPNIKGVNDSVFFLEHTERELGDTSDTDSRSRLNPYEAEMALALTKHLLLQGYEPSKITVLTTYSGQLFHLRKLRKQMNLLQNVRITVVDNFQGEENDIIILSLVRSNEDASIGFLKTDNRICVALSRAKHGFYLIGNMNNLKTKSKQWREINQVLAANGQIGKKLTLRCEIHNVLIDAARAQDFPPEGGCFNKCMTEMPCKHICRRVCHAEDREHSKQKCLEKCTRSCLVGHPCPKLCYQDCHPCMTNVPKVLPCLHSQMMACYKDPNNEFCLTQVLKKLPVCDHEKEMDCGRDPAQVRCAELCGMLLDCQHFCDRICHKKSSHEELNCTQSCLRACPAGHPCPKKCFEDCGNCVVDVRKKLPCGHDGILKCWILPKDAYCGVEVTRSLPNCQHTADLECSASIDQYRCQEKCGKIQCDEGHICQKRCFEDCGKCFVRVERLLCCGHTAKVECYVDPGKIKCKVQRNVTLPCGHKVDVPCYEGTNAKCPMPCQLRLRCGHQCTNSCHVNSDPDHANYECNKPCARKRKGCKLNHKCARKCKEECDPCTVKDKRTLPCGHEAFVVCSKDDADIYCSQIVKKRILDCGHEIQTACSLTPTRKDCREPCSLKLGCNHQCLKRCSEPCNILDCTVLVKLNRTATCGHKVSIPCNKYRSNMVTKEDLDKFMLNCPEPCNAILSCEHACKGTCGGCLNGRLHQACKEKCGRTLICGHNCEVDCASSCPPCKKVCEYRCRHSKCSTACCEPCSDCIEPCDWKCKHQRCTQKCGEICNRSVCNEPCLNKLACGHQCIGLCGETCPPLCRICDSEQLTEFVLYGYEEDEDARFVYLEDCKHCIEVNGLDHWMKMEQDPAETSEIQMKCCPRCKSIIRTSLRYGNIIKRTLKDIVLVKEKLLYNRSSSKSFADDLQLKLNRCKLNNDKLKSELNHGITQLINNGLVRIEKTISPTMKQKKLIYPSVAEITRYMLQVQVDVIEAMLGMLENAAKVKPNQLTNQHFPALRTTIDSTQIPMNPLLLHDLLDRASRVITLLVDRDRFAHDEHQHYLDEIKRLDLIRAFYILNSSPNYQQKLQILQRQVNELNLLLLGNVRKITESEKAVIKTHLEAIAKQLNTGLGISDRERKEIVGAMGLSQGHWYKCPNGHIYVITECGGAMQEGRCNECGAPIGGGRHRLRSDNQLAGEMDGARHPAWGDIANNMANFRF